MTSAISGRWQTVQPVQIAKGSIMRVREIVAAITSRFIHQDDVEEAQAIVEYALLLVLIAVVSMTIIGTVGDNVSGVFVKIDEALTAK
jgi:Flp pilus assembly pilin Flp